VVKAIADLLPQSAANGSAKPVAPAMSSDEYLVLIDDLEAEMRRLADALEFEKAAEIRDQLATLRSQVEAA
jgi:excinuclease UvrABC helicase subunit UvrB